MHATTTRSRRHRAAVRTDDPRAGAVFRAPVARPHAAGRTFGVFAVCAAAGRRAAPPDAGAGGAARRRQPGAGGAGGPLGRARCAADPAQRDGLGDGRAWPHARRRRLWRRRGQPRLPPHLRPCGRPLAATARRCRAAPTTSRWRPTTGASRPSAASSSRTAAPTPWPSSTRSRRIAGRRSRRCRDRAARPRLCCSTARST